MSRRSLPESADAPIFKTPDGRYLVVSERLWRAANPHLPESVRSSWVSELMEARRQLRNNAPLEGRAAARKLVDEAKRALGERGPVWWEDEAPDLNRHLVKNSPYADWYADMKIGHHQSLPPES